MLYTVGDSFTYGQELPDPATQAWPVLLAKRLGYHLINDGTPGVGNEFMVKKTMQAVAKHKPELVIVAWTSCARTEFADEWGYTIHGPDVVIVYLMKILNLNTDTN